MAEKWESDERLDMKLISLLGMTYGGSFHHVGLETPRKMIEAIQAYGLTRVGNHYEFASGAEAPYVRNCGKKKWNRMFEFLEEMGFDWSKYVVRRYMPEVATPAEMRLALRRDIRRLIILLERYLDE